MKISRAFFLLVFALGVWLPLHGQTGGALSVAAPTTVQVQDLKLNSKLMTREMPYRVILPAGYEKGTARFSVIYLLHGLTGHFDNWADKTNLKEYAAWR
jgi:S-formylglutathione hydrolase FrmB